MVHLLFSQYSDESTRESDMVSLSVAGRVQRNLETSGLGDGNGLADGKSAAMQK
jgi:hypothetical protein